jgi:hypothetical protein
MQSPTITEAIRARRVLSFHQLIPMHRSLCDHAEHDEIGCREGRVAYLSFSLMP